MSKKDKQSKKRTIRNLTGETFNMLCVLHEDGRRKNEKLWLCKCECGNLKQVTTRNLISERVRSCGCMQKIIAKESVKKATNSVRKHNKSNTRLYVTWQDMKKRCLSKNNSNYYLYGERGIQVCDDWIKAFENFYIWAYENGYNDDLQIDRIDVDGNYEPSNCRWVTPKINSRNKRNNIYINFKNRSMTLTEVSEITNIPFTTLKSYWKKGELLEYITQRVGGGVS